MSEKLYNYKSKFPNDTLARLKIVICQVRGEDKAILPLGRKTELALMMNPAEFKK
jgi:hypothetical protein